MIKKTKAKAAEEATGKSVEYRDNPQVNAKIDDFIANNPKRWEYIQAMPRERLERALVLTDVQKNERQQKMSEGIMKKLERDPELKRTYENLVKDLPEDQREKAMVTIASRTMRDIAARQSRSNGSRKI